MLQRLSGRHKGGMYSYPESWAGLAHPNRRAELMSYLDELRDPGQTAAWLAPPADGLVIGIDQTIHYFFDDNDFDEGDIGFALLDAGEAASIGRVKAEIDAILRTNERGDDRYFLTHPRRQKVVSAADEAYRTLAERGTAVWTADD